MKNDNNNTFWEELGQRLFDVIDIALPSMNWKMTGGGRWVSKTHIDGETSTDEASTIYPNNPLWIKDFARGYKSVIWAVVDLEHKAETYIDALAYLCRFAGLDVPAISDEQLARVMSTRRLNEAQRAYHSALLDDPSMEAQAVRDYLIRRGWSEWDVRNSGLGYVSETTRVQLYTDEEAAKIAADPKHPMHYVGKYYTLAIPVFGGGDVTTFKFRNIFATEKKNRYRGLQGAAKVCLGGIQPRGHADTVIIVEGEMDALHDLSIWRQLGQDGKKMDRVPVASTGGGAVTPQMAEDAVRRGVTYFILALDQDEHKSAYTEASAKNIHAAGGVALVIDYPDGYKDLDEMLCDLVETEGGKKRPKFSVYDFQRMAKEAQPFAVWYADRLLAPALNGQEIDELESYKIRREIGKAIASTPAEERPFVVKAIEALHLDGIDAQALSRETAEETRNKARVATLRRAADCLSRGDQNGAEKALKRLESLKEGPDTAETTFAAQSLQVFDAETPTLSGLPTPYHLTAADGMEVQLTIKEEAITTFGARSGHGKTAMLLNLAVCCLNAIADGEAVVYISAETSRKSLARRLYNVLAGRKGLPMDVAMTEVNQALESGKLKLFRDRDARVISDRIQTLGTKCRVRAVIIDYIQLLRVAGFKGSKKERMEEVCSILEAMAVDTSAAVIIGAQLNRLDTKDPVSWGADSIGDAIDIEQVSSDIFLLWNTAKKVTGDKTIDSVNAELRQMRLRATVGQAGKLIVRCIKARDEHLGSGGNAVWLFNREDCAISQESIKTTNTVSRIVF